MNFNFKQWLVEQARSYFGTIDIDWDEESVEQIVNKIKQVGCDARPDGAVHGAVATFGEEDFKDITCVIKGEKPLAWVRVTKTWNEKIKHIAELLFAEARKRGLAVLPQNRTKSGTGYIVGKPEVVRRFKYLADAHDRYQHWVNSYQNSAEFKNRHPEPPPFPADLHRELGQMLGYSDADIEEFIKHQPNVGHEPNWRGSYESNPVLQSIEL